MQTRYRLIRRGTRGGIFGSLMGNAFKPVRQIRIGFWNLLRLDTQPTLWGKTEAERWGALDEATHKLNGQFARTDKQTVMTGTQLALRQLDEAHKSLKAKWHLAKSSKQHQFTGKA